MGKVPAVHIPSTTVTLGRAAHICDPSVEGRQRQVDPVAYQLASLNESMSSELTERMSPQTRWRRIEKDPQ